MVKNMKKYLKKFKIEYLLYLFIIIAPILDASSYIFKTAFPNSNITPTLIIRPIIPLILLVYIYIKDKSKRLPLIVSSIIYIVYGIIHLLLTKNLITPLSIGNVVDEAKYIINYTYMIYVLFIFIYFINEKNIQYLKKSMIISLFVYLLIIYFSIVSGTSATTYLEGTGFRSYFVSGNSLCTSLLMLTTVLLIDIRNNKILNSILYLLTGIFLIFLVGTRTGLLGFILVSIFYGLLLIFTSKKVSKRNILIGASVFAITIFLIFIFGSETISRRIELRRENQEIIDVNTGKPGHTTGDISNFVYKINNNTLEEGYMSIPQEKAFLSTYKYCNDKKIDATNRRTQELIYNLYLVKYQHNIAYILFGNAFYSNYGEMVLEMETPAILINFGVLGFILYIVPFIYVFIISLKYSLKKKRIDNYFYLFTSLMVFALSFLAGYVFFSGTCALLLSSLLSMTYRKD